MSIQVQGVLEVMNGKITEHMEEKGTEHLCFITEDKLISLLELGLNNCAFSFHRKFSQ